MKILHILAYAYRGGCEKNCYQFINSTPELAHEVAVMSAVGPMVATWKELGVRVHVFSILNLPLPIFLLRFKAALPNHAYDKIIVWTSVRMPVILFALNKYKGAEVFVHFGNPLVSKTTTRLKNQVLSTLLPVRNTIFVRPVSSFVAASLKADPYYGRFPLKVSMKPIQAAPYLGKEPVPITTTASLKMGMVARLDPIKDHRTVLVAFKQILNCYPQAQLYLVGDGLWRQKLEVYCTELKLTSAYFLGDVEDVYSYMKQWDVFIYGTTLQEGLGGTVPEALSMGLPVVATDLPMVREWDRVGNFISYARSADPSDMAEKIIQLVADLPRRRKIHNTAPAYIKSHFSPRSFSLHYITA